jgi:hypothetical protein
MKNVMYILCVFNAFSSAAGCVSMRQMKKFHGSVITWYSNWSIMISALLAIAVTGSGISIFYTFSSLSWFLLIVNGVTATTE